MQSRSEDQSVNKGGEIYPSTVNPRQRLDTGAAVTNESEKDESSEQQQKKDGNQLSKDENPVRQPSVTQISTAASFFTRAGQKLTITSNSKRKRKSSHNDACDISHLTGYINSQSYRHNQHSKCVTSFSEAVHHHPPPMPPTLLKWGRNGSNSTVINNRVGKVKVILQLHSDHETDKETQKASCLTIEKRKNQVCLNDPNVNTNESSTSPKRTNMHGPKLFAMDGIFTEEDSMAELCAFALTDIIQSVVNGSDGCLISFGTRDSIKTNSMFGDDKQSSGLGIIPSAISWLFRLISEQKERTGARFSVRISAVEVYGKEEALRDLLSSVSNATEAAGANAPGIYLRDDPISGTHFSSFIHHHPLLPNPVVLWKRNSHLFFTLHIYQYRVERSGIGSGVAGGRSRLHLIDLGNAKLSKDMTPDNTVQDSDSKDSENKQHSTSSNDSALSLSSMTSVVLALINGNRHHPHRDSKLSQMLREAVSSIGCRTCILIQTSPSASYYQENLQLLQFASKIQRGRRHKTHDRTLSESSSNNTEQESKMDEQTTSSEDSSSCDSFGLRRAGRLRLNMGLRSAMKRSNGYKGFSTRYRHYGPDSHLSLAASSEKDYTSSSEQSCDTVIYLGRQGLLDHHHDSSQKARSRLGKPLSGSNIDTDSEASGGSKVKQFGGQQSHGSPVGSSVGVPSGSGGGESGSGGHSGSHANSGDLYSPHAVHSKERKKSAPRTNVYAWPRNAVKNAIETLSTQKEQWVDGPKSDFHPPSTSHQISQTSSTALPKRNMIDKETQVDELNTTPVQVVNQTQTLSQETCHPSVSSYVQPHPSVSGREISEKKDDDWDRKDQEKQAPCITKSPIMKPTVSDRSTSVPKSTKLTQMEINRDRSSDNADVQNGDATLSSQCSTCVMVSSLMNQSNSTVETGDTTNITAAGNSASIVKPQSTESWTPSHIPTEKEFEDRKHSIPHISNALRNTNYQTNLHSNVRQPPNEIPLTKPFMTTGIPSDTNAPVARVKPFVKDWIQKHSTLPAASSVHGDFSKINEQHQLHIQNNQTEIPGGSKLCNLANTAISMTVGEIGSETQQFRHHMFHGRTEHMKHEDKLCMNKCSSKLPNYQCDSNSSFANTGHAPFTNSLQTSSNFARIAAWVKSVSVETCNIQEASLNKPNDSGTALQQPDFPHDVCMNDNINHNLFNHNQKCFCHKHFEKDDNFPEEKPLYRHHMNRSGVHNYENAVMRSPQCVRNINNKLRRGRSVPPSSLQEGGFTEVHDICDGYLKQESATTSEKTVAPLPISISSGPLCVKEEICNTGRKSDRDTPPSRRPDGSSNPHLHRETQGASDVQEMAKSETKTPYTLNEKPSNQSTGFWASTKKPHLRTNTKAYPVDVSASPSATANQHSTTHITASPLRKKCFSPEAKKKSNKSHHDSESHLLVCTSPKSSKCRRSHSFCSSTDSDHSVCRNEQLTDSSKAQKPSNVIDYAQNDDNTTKSSILQSVMGKKPPKEVRTKTSKGRLSFLTSPLFGKRKEKETKQSETAGNTPEKGKTSATVPDSPRDGHSSAKNCDSRRKTQSKDLSSCHQKRHNSSQFDTSESQTRIGCIRRDKPTSKHTSLEKQHSEDKNAFSPSTHVSNIPVSFNTATTPTKNSSLQSSSGHGSECSSSLFTEKSIAWHSKAEPNTALRCRCKRHHHHHAHQHHYHSGNGQRCHRCITSTHVCRSDHRSDRKCETVSEVRKPADGERSSESSASATGHRKCANRETTEYDENSTDGKVLLDSFETSKLSIGIPCSHLSGSGPRRGGGHASSGYESIVRDSEASSHADSTSGSSAGGTGVVTADVKESNIISQTQSNEQGYCEHCQRVNQTNLILADRSSQSQQVMQTLSTINYSSQEKTDNEQSIQNNNNNQTIQSNLQTVQTMTISKTDSLVNNHESSCQVFQHIQLKSPTKQSFQQHSANSKSSATSKTVTSQSLSSSSSTSHRSRSAPPCSEDTSEETTSSPISVRYVATKQNDNASSKLSTNMKSSLPENSSNVSCILPMYLEEVQEMERQIRYEKTYDLLAQQDMLKMELMTAKDRLLIDPSTWSFDLYVAEQMDPDDPSFLEALEKETEILRKRVDACKSHIMLITCFDSQLKSGQITNTINSTKNNQTVNTNTDLNQTSIQHQN
ncbi:unnamed protein product [Trichobilharzia szidati]|nr:unnamed protein product [Trichobilharzia szidati]